LGLNSAISSLFPSSVPPHIRRVTCSTTCPCLLDADWWLQPGDRCLFQQTFVKASDNSTRLPQLERELRDAVWVRCLKAAFEGAVNDKVVLDLYSGLGIRALLAARAGARAVYAVTTERIPAPRPRSAASASAAL